MLVSAQRPSGLGPTYRGTRLMTALKVFETFLEAQTPVAEGEAVPTKPFVYISAADAFRPVVPSRYIESKREAEFGILRKSADRPELGIRPLFMRPGKSFSPCFVWMLVFRSRSGEVSAGYHNPDQLIGR